MRNRLAWLKPLLIGLVGANMMDNPSDAES